MTEVLVLSKQDIKSLVTMKDAIPLVEEAYRIFTEARLGELEAAFPAVTNYSIQRFHGEFDFRSSYVERVDYLCSVLGFGYGENPVKYGIPAISAVCVLNDVSTGVPLAFMEAEFLSTLRTGAAGAVAARYLARKDCGNICVIGTGSQGRSQLEGLNELYKIERVRAYSRRREGREKYAREMKDRFGLDVSAVDDPKAAVEDADIIVTATRSHEPIVMNEWIGPGVHINAFGADAPGKQELDINILPRSKIVVDSLDQCKMIGEIHKAIAKGVIHESDIYGEIGEVVSGKKKGRIDDDEITVFDSTGLAVQDLVAFSKVYKLAKECNVGSWVNF